MHKIKSDKKKEHGELVLSNEEVIDCVIYEEYISCERNYFGFVSRNDWK